MKIDRFELRHYQLPYSRPVRWFNSNEDAADFIALRLFADGAVGIAESTIKANWCGLSVRAFAALVGDLLVPAFDKIDITDPSAIDAALAVFPSNPIAKGLVQNACAALAANASVQPLWQSLGGKDNVEVSWCVTRQPPEMMAKEAESMVAQYGFRVLKIKGGQGMEVDRTALRMISAAVGKEVELTVDANEAYTMQECPDYLKLLHDEGVVVAEDPYKLTPDKAFSDLLAATPLPILVDSPCISAKQASAFLDAGATAISVKPGRIGIHEAGAIVALAGRHGADICSGMFAESALGTLISLSFSSALPAPFLPAEQTFFMMMREQILDGVVTVENGRVALGSDHNLNDLIDWTRTELI
ncbi:MAG: enolase C-terminal domain-like protein [Rhizobiaceae bacterium]|nr:enolase C-terminal domain-like protein [Rhizobiaceae bacterium]